MAGFLYFFPLGNERVLEKGTINPAVLEKCGLTSVFSETNTLPDTCTSHKCTGPEGLGGIVLCPKPTHGENPPHGTYNASSQRWFDRDEFWIGVEKGNEPTPRDLERKDMYGGFALNDRHGNRWVLPVIRLPEGKQGSVPVEYGFHTNGEMYTRVCGQFSSVWELAGEALDLLQCSGEERLERWSEADQVKMAIQFLGMHYRLSMHEITALMECNRAVIDTEFAVNVLIAVTNWPIWVEYLKTHDSEKKKSELAISPAAA